MDDIIKLLSVTQTQDDFGVYREEITEKQVFCHVSSVSAAEFFDGGRNGLKPSYRMTMFFGDYDGEDMLVYNGKSYSIYRTYRQNDTLELYVEEKGGTNGKTNQT